MVDLTVAVAITGDNVRHMLASASFFIFNHTTSPDDDLHGVQSMQRKPMWCKMRYLEGDRNGKNISVRRPEARTQ
jgi:hypothetical protein